VLLPATPASAPCEDDPLQSFSAAGYSSPLASAPAANLSALSSSSCAVDDDENPTCNDRKRHTSTQRDDASQIALVVVRSNHGQAGDVNGDHPTIPASHSKATTPAAIPVILATAEHNEHRPAVERTRESEESQNGPSLSDSDTQHEQIFKNNHLPQTAPLASTFVSSNTGVVATPQRTIPVSLAANNSTNKHSTQSGLADHDDALTVVRVLSLSGDARVDLCVDSTGKQVVRRSFPIASAAASMCAGRRQLSTLKPHPNVVSVLHHHINNTPRGDRMHVMVEFAVNGSLTERLSSSTTSTASSGLNISNVLSVLQPILLGLDYLHSSDVVHGNLSSRTILFSADNVPMIADCSEVLCSTGSGINTRLSGCQAGKGITMFDAPELLSGKSAHPTCATDVYACGVTAFIALNGLGVSQSPFKSVADMLTGTVAWDGLSTAIATTANGALMALLKSMLTLDPEERPSALEACAQLKRIQRQLVNTPSLPSR
jgi:hypothetical protein